MIEWCLWMAVTACLDHSGGFILAATLESGELGAVCVVAPNLHGNPSKVASGCLLLRGLCKNGLPPFKEMGDARKGILKRFEGLVGIEEMHGKHASGSHVYVNVMAVHPDAQGKGLCGKLMRQVNVYADKQKLPLYLETSGQKM